MQLNKATVKYLTRVHEKSVITSGLAWLACLWFVCVYARLLACLFVCVTTWKSGETMVEAMLTVCPVWRPLGPESGLSWFLRRRQ